MWPAWVVEKAVSSRKAFSATTIQWFSKSVQSIDHGLLTWTAAVSQKDQNGWLVLGQFEDRLVLRGEVTDFGHRGDFSCGRRFKRLELFEKMVF